MTLVSHPYLLDKLKTKTTPLSSIANMYLKTFNRTDKAESSFRSKYTCQSHFPACILRGTRGTQKQKAQRSLQRLQYKLRVLFWTNQNQTNSHF